MGRGGAGVGGGGRQVRSGEYSSGESVFGSRSSAVALRAPPALSAERFVQSRHHFVLSGAAAVSHRTAAVH